MWHKNTASFHVLKYKASVHFVRFLGCGKWTDELESEKAAVGCSCCLMQHEHGIVEWL